MIGVRMADTKDIPFIAMVEGETFSDPWSEEAIASHFASPFAISIVVEEGDRPLGYLLGSLLAPESELYRIAVLRDARRGGLGRAILDFFLDEMRRRGAESVYLEVRESNRAARELYLSAGFTEIGIRKNYYRRPDENAAILVKGLLC